MPDPTKDFKVAVVGGGMCGLLCAINLSRAGIHVEVFEKAGKFGEVGSGVGLGPNAVAALRKLGVLKEILSQADEKNPSMAGFRFISGLGDHEHIYDYPPRPSDVGLGVYRPAFLNAIAPLLDPSLVHFNHRCESISVSPSGLPTLKFANGAIYEADLVIGADGIKSTIRNFVSDGSARTVWSNTVAYRAVIPIESFIKNIKTNIMDWPLNWVGRDRHIITFPIQGQKFLNIVAFCTLSKDPNSWSERMSSPWVETATADELLEQYSGWGPDITAILRETKKSNKWYIHFMTPTLPTYFRQRVVLIGDAAHAMLTHLAAGVGQGFEDVLVLSSLLGDPRTRACHLDVIIHDHYCLIPSSFPGQDILKAYDEIRVPRANKIHQDTIEVGNIYECRGKRGGSPQQMREQLEGIWDSVWYHDQNKDVEQAIARVHGEGERL